jgi:hypothetical protein
VFGAKKAKEPLGPTASGGDGSKDSSTRAAVAQSQNKGRDASNNGGKAPAAIDGMVNMSGVDGMAHIDLVVVRPPLPKARPPHRARPSIW